MRERPLGGVVRTLALAGLCAIFCSTNQAAPGSALRFDGTNGSIQISHNAALNAYPLTVTAWFRTTNTANVVQGLASKYADNSFNGWALLVINGRLRGFFYTTSGYPLDATSTAVVADGYWHHAAMVVDASGGKLYLDGALVASSGWFGFTGGPTTTMPLQIGHYFNYTQHFQGDIDEVAVWNRALGSPELNHLKHRHLNGQEPGLVALWRMNDNAGAIALDSTGHGYNGTLTGSPPPTWVPSTAPLVFSQVSGKSLSLDGVNDHVSVPHAADLNSYPLTLTAWIKTSRNAANYDGILSKYVPASGNGCSLHLYSGRLYAFYFRDSLNRIYTADPGVDGGFVADDQWHHVAFTVGPAGGKLYVDGVQTGSQGWTGSAGAPSTTTPLLIGQYLNYGAFLGQMDEVRIWNRELTATEVQSLRSVRLSGTEANLVAYWRLDEPSGTSALDTTGLGHTGTLQNGPLQVDSTAFLGDGSTVIHPELGPVQWTRRFAVKTIPSQRGFAAMAPFWMRRLDDFGAPTTTANVLLTLDHSLGSLLLAGPVPLVNNSTQFNIALAAYNAAIPQATTGGIKQTPVLALEPQPGTQIDSVNDTLQLQVAQQYSIDGGVSSSGETAILPPIPLLHFNGHLLFGSIDTTFSSLSNTPNRGAPSGGGISTVLAVDGNSGTLVGNPAFHYGNGAPLNAILLSSGDALAAAGTVVALTGADTACIQNICFQRSNVTLSNDSIRGDVTLQLPLGFSVCTNFSDSSRITVGHLQLSNAALSFSLVPQSDVVTWTGPFFAAEETKPFWIEAPDLGWDVAAGQIRLENPASIRFVRQEEDDQLAMLEPFLEPGVTRRVSNDGYYRNASVVAGLPVVVRADTNGVAQLSAQINLSPPELRPHFPYAGRSDGTQIPAAPGGTLVIENSLISSNSVLPLAGPVPVPYARDCLGADCLTSTSGPAILQFLPTSSQLRFTPGGGLLGFGSVPPTELAWGFAGGTNYAQRAFTVQEGVYHMPGTFLQAAETGLADSSRPAVLLFSGRGNATTENYIERPGAPAYAEGFANYAGLNFRAPAQGLSYLAGQVAGPYALTPRSKYYARYGGISGIHESASFPANLSLYGYNFAFTTYRLSFLDSLNWESRTDGAISFPPQPAGFVQEFERMKLTCRGALESAQVPSSSGLKHLNYWNVDFTPKSIQFKPPAADLCSLSQRFLVLGVETRLPLVAQAVHAALGFKPNGNLVTAANPAAGVNSRFPVPAQLSLQGPGGSSYPLSTVGEGYFNNWETPSRPAAGFFNVAGKLDVPFFEDVKVHLQITPSSPSSAQIDVMGGWRSVDGLGEDRGWSSGTQNYFTVSRFDLNHDGWPVSVPITEYRRSSTLNYHPRAQRDWIEVARFDYPLQWNSVLRRFSGFQDAKVILPVIDVNSRLKELSPGKVDFDFAQDVSLQLPRIKVLDFINDAQNELNKPLLSVSNAIRQQIGLTLNAVGLNALQKALREDARAFFDPILAPALQPAANAIHAQLVSLYQNNPAGFLNGVSGVVTDPANGLQSALSGINGSAGQADKVIGQLDQALGDIDATIGVLIQALQKDGSGNRHVIRTIIQRLIQDQGPELGFISNVADTQLNALLAELEPTLAEITRDLTEVRAQLAAARTQLNQVSGGFRTALASSLNAPLAMQKFLELSAVNVRDLMAASRTPAGDFLTADPDGVRRAIRDRLAASFLGSPICGNYQKTIRGFLYDQDFLLNQLMDALFDQINRSIRNGLSSFIAGAQDGVFQNMKGAGFLSQSLLSAQIRGAPTFNGDSLRRIHLDAAVKMNLPDEINFNAYLDIKEMDSTTVPISCIPAGSPAAEVSLGARDVPLDWTGVPALKPLTVTVEARWTLQNRSVIGIGGLFEVRGEAGFKGCNVKTIGATLAIGAFENYFAAKAAGSVIILGIPVDVQAGVFAGKACSLDALKFIDPEADQVLSNPALFSGVYVQFGGGLSLSDILFGGSSCLLDVRAAISTAVYYQGGPRFGIIGGRQKTSLDIDLICFLSGHVDWALFMAFDADAGQLTVGGSANVCGEIGYCPFCVEGCKGIIVKGVLNDGGIDYFIDL